MKKPADTHVPVAKTLAEQEADFTAEGAPPPVKSSAAKAVGTPDPRKATPPAIDAGATSTLKQPLKGRERAG
jgi:hypothetical protein